VDLIGSPGRILDAYPKRFRSNEPGADKTGTNGIEPVKFFPPDPIRDV
jgi:hypothetical protein